MRKFILGVVIFSSSIQGNAQNNKVDTLTKEELKYEYFNLLNDNKQLKSTIKAIDSCNYNHEKYLFCESININTATKVNTTLKNLDFKLLSADGDRNAQSVTITFLVTNKGLNQKVYIDRFGATAIDGIGNGGLISEISVGSETHFGTIYTNVPVRIKLTFNSIMPGTEIFKMVAFKMSSVDVNSQASAIKEQVELRNVLINW